MKKYAIILGEKDFLALIKDTARLLVKALLRIPYLIGVGLVSVIYWLVRLVVNFCKEYTKAAVIIGFVVCFMLMIAEFVYFKLQLEKSSYRISELIKQNYELEQTDRYDIGFHDAMAKTKEMLTTN